MSSNIKTYRRYHKVTPEQVASYRALEALLGNGAAAVRAMIPGHKDPSRRAFRIREKSQAMATEQFIDDQFQQIGVDAVNRLGELVASPDEKIATKNVHYAIDHIRGKPTQKSIVAHGKFNIQNVLE